MFSLIIFWSAVITALLFVIPKLNQTGRSIVFATALIICAISIFNASWVTTIAMGIVIFFTIHQEEVSNGEKNSTD